jgi:hypothetical protein
MLGMLGGSPATFTTADLIKLADTIQKHPGLTALPIDRPASPAAAAGGSGLAMPKSGAATPSLLGQGQCHQQQQQQRQLLTGYGPAEGAALLLSKLGVPITS